MRSCLLLCLIGFVLDGCTHEPSGQSAHASKPAAPKAAQQPVKLAPVAPPAAAPQAPIASPPTLTVAAEQRAAPASFEALRGASREDLGRWLKEGESPPELQVVMLQDLNAQSEPDALGVAIELAAAETSDRLVRANAVALLVRSQDPRAAEAIAALPEKYQRLAAALRKTQ